jgi:mannose-1-phosphate guanylyltransferase
VKRDPSKLILLGVKPDREEPEYGYLLPNKNRVGIGRGMFEISWFIEKPDQKTARRVIQAGGLWNTMIMVFKTKTMLHWVSRLAPRLYQEFQQVYAAIGTPGETDVVRNIYRRLRPINFSTEFLEPMVKNYPSTLVALPVPDLLWSDWGTASRIIDVLARIGKVPRLPDSRRTKKIASGNPFDRELLPFDGDFQGRKVAVHK